MRAVVLREYGGPEVLQVEDVPDPVPGPEEVLVDITATALNRADTLQRMGLYPGPDTDYEIPGLEYAGVVAGVGERVTGRAVGDAVMGIVSGGAYAEKLVVHERQTLAAPTSMPLADAAGIPEVFLTAWDALVVQGGLTSGRTALVHAGASGVGTASIQIAKALGARIVVTASAGKVAACRDLGADLAVDYGSEDFAEAVAAFTGGAGVDVVLDVIGGDETDRNLTAVAMDGAVVQVGLMGGAKASVNVGLILSKRITWIGTTLRARPVERKLALSQRFIAEMIPLFDSGAMHPVIDSRYAFGDIADAHRHMEANANVGKILIDL